VNCVGKVMTYYGLVFYISREMVTSERWMFVDDQGNVSSEPSERKTRCCQLVKRCND